MNVLVIHNTASGFGDGAIYDFIRSYAEEGDNICIRPFSGKNPLKDLLTDAHRFDFVVACGGDGTVASIVYELRYTNIPILPFPAGTANLLALNLMMPEEPRSICKIADEAITLDFDIGEIETPYGKVGFDVMAGCGWDHHIMQVAEENKKLLGPMAYFHAAVTSTQSKASKFKFVIDGKPIESKGVSVLVTNFSKIQFDITISNHNSPRDGLFDIVVLKTEKAIDLLPTFLAKVVDKSGDLSDKIGALEVFQGRDIIIEANPAMKLEYDGEPVDCETPIRIRNLHNAARLMVSRECANYYASLN